MAMYFLAVLVLLSNVNFIYSDICADINYDCDACIGNIFNCVWCGDEIHNDTRCRLSRSPTVTPSWCQNIMSPTTEPEIIIINEDFRSKTKDVDAVQLKPQHVSIRARSRNEVEFEMSYKPDMNRPVDVYYLFDSSKSMQVYREIFKAQVAQIYNALKEINGDIRFGIGSLNIKDTESRENEDRNILFKNEVNLTDDISKIIDADNLENLGGLKNVLQGLIEALESKEITWIEDARRTVVLFCDPRNTIQSLSSLELDRLVRQIDRISRTKHINIIFTGLKDFQNESKQFAEEIRGSTYVELKDITDDGKEGVIDLASAIKDEFMKLAHILELDIGVIPHHLSLTIKPDFERFGRRYIRKVNTGTPLFMLAKIDLRACPYNRKFKHVTTIKPFGTYENWTIDTNVLCDCECSEKPEANSLKCSAMGDYVCGICKCYKGRYGDSCQCVGDYIEDGWQNCRAGPDDFYFSGCNGHGACICGVCHCHDGYEGKHCTITTAATSMLLHDDVTEIPPTIPGPPTD